MTSDRISPSQSSNLSWTLTLFGAAVGAGILFLPIRAGLSGFWVTLFLAVFIYPVIFFSHRLFAAMVFQARKTCDYTGAVEELLSPRIGSVVAVLFSALLLMLLLAYTTALNNSLGEFFMDQGLAKIDIARGPFLSLGMLALFLSLLRFGSGFVVRILGVLSALLIVLLLAVSVLMVDFWHFEVVFQTPKLADIPRNLLLLFPILIESFIFFPALSSMVILFRQESNTLLEGKQRSARVIRHATIILVIFTMFFVFSCLFALKASQLTMAAANNLSVLDILGDASSPILDKLGPLVSIIALTTSFFGIFLGYKESFLRLMARYGLGARENMFFVGTFIVLWSFTTFNVSVLYILGEIGGPLSALFLFLIPVAVHLKHRDRLKEHRGILIFVFCVGMVQLMSYFLGAL